MKIFLNGGSPNLPNSWHHAVLRSTHLAVLAFSSISRRRPLLAPGVQGRPAAGTASCSRSVAAAATEQTAAERLRALLALTGKLMFHVFFFSSWRLVMKARSLHKRLAEEPFGLLWRDEVISTFFECLEAIRWRRRIIPGQ